jgi:hypothetical protein
LYLLVSRHVLLAQEHHKRGQQDLLNAAGGLEESEGATVSAHDLEMAFLVKFVNA